MTPTTSIKSKNNDKLCDTKVRLLCEEAEQEISHLYDIFDILVPKKIEKKLTNATKSINNNETSNMSSKIATYQDDDEWEENLPLCQLLEPKTRPPSWKWRKTFSKLVVPEIELDWLQNMRLLATPPPPPQTAEFGWGSQQEANKTKMKKTKTNKTNKTKK